jgi:hypothetical protein
MQKQLQTATEDPVFKKLREHKIIILQYLQRPEYKMLREYFQARKDIATKALIYNYKKNNLEDISGQLRGTIQVLEEFLELEHVFDRFDTLEKTVRDEEEKMKKGAK